ncbi:unnamed protein product [Larinioides sclopetarius]|uniref:Uncharacterized protein n=1 Tax=Larinioides sclopetarius TaxID=280406 RepID=A0AAV2B2D0_9ARAC
MLRGRELQRRPVEARQPNRFKEVLFAGIQAVGGAALAVYTNKNSASRIWPIVYSVVAIGGTCNAFRSILKIFRRSTCCRSDGCCSTRNVVTGTIVYFSNVYAFSEAWKCNHKLWIPCLGVAASGYCFAVSSINDESSDVDWLYPQWPVKSAKKSNVLLLTAIEMLMGGFLFATSNVMLAFYVELFTEFHPSWCAYLYGMSLFGCFFIIFSIMCLQIYADMDEEVQYCLDGMITAAVILSYSSYLMVKYMNYNRMVYITFPFLAESCHLLFWALFNKLYTLVPQPVFDGYCQTLGPLLAVFSSVTSAYVGYHKGWRFSLPMMTFKPAGIYTTHKGFRRRGEVL